MPTPYAYALLPAPYCLLPMPTPYAYARWELDLVWPYLPWLSRLAWLLLLALQRLCLQALVADA